MLNDGLNQQWSTKTRHGGNLPRNPMQVTDNPQQTEPTLKLFHVFSKSRTISSMGLWVLCNIQSERAPRAKINGNYIAGKTTNSSRVRCGNSYTFHVSEGPSALRPALVTRQAVRKWWSMMPITQAFNLQRLGSHIPVISPGLGCTTDSWEL